MISEIREIKENNGIYNNFLVKLNDYIINLINEYDGDNNYDIITLKKCVSKFYHNNFDKIIDDLTSEQRSKIYEKIIEIYSKFNIFYRENKKERQQYNSLKNEITEILKN